LEAIKTDNGYILTVDTYKGPQRLNTPKWISVYHWSKNGQKKCEAWIPDWLCQKAGLI